MKTSILSIIFLFSGLFAHANIPAEHVASDKPVATVLSPDEEGGRNNPVKVTGVKSEEELSDFVDEYLDKHYPGLSASRNRILINHSMRLISIKNDSGVQLRLYFDVAEFMAHYQKVNKKKIDQLVKKAEREMKKRELRK